MSPHTITTPKARAGDRVAVLSPALAAPAVSAAVHEQAMQRLKEVTGLIPVEYPTTRLLNASAEARADDVMAAFADPTIRAVLATVGGDDQITVVPHIDTDVLAADPKPFLGYSDNTHLHNLLWGLGMLSFYGGSTQVHLGPGPRVDEVHRISLRAALLEGGEVELTDPGESEDHGLLWTDPRALREYGVREPTEPWAWAGPARSVSGRTWGGCIEVIDQIALAGRMPAVSDLEGAILLIETSEETPPAAHVRRWVRSLGEGGVLGAVSGVLVARPRRSWVRSLGEGGVLGAVSGVLVARPPVTSFDRLVPEQGERDALRAEQRDAIVAEVTRYNADAVVCVGVPFGHTRPQWIVPHGGVVRLDGSSRTVTADYS